MSGGSWDYMYQRLDDAADRLQCEKDALRRAFGQHVKLVAKALHDIEWVDSCDYGKGDELPAIKAVLGVQQDALVLEIVRDDARKILKQITELLNQQH